jgi:hypothetical protein
LLAWTSAALRGRAGIGSWRRWRRFAPALLNRFVFVSGPFAFFYHALVVRFLHRTIAAVVSLSWGWRRSRRRRRSWVWSLACLFFAALRVHRLPCISAEVCRERGLRRLAVVRLVVVRALTVIAPALVGTMVADALPRLGTTVARQAAELIVACRPSSWRRWRRWRRWC